MNKIKFFLLIFFLLVTSKAFGVTAYQIKDTTLKDIGGNVGINTTAADQKLWVNGNVSASQVNIGGVISKTYDLNSAIISYYKLEDNAANTTVTDTQGVHNGTASGNTSGFTTTGKIGNGFTFNQLRDVDLGSTSDFKFAGDFSIAVWLTTTTSLSIRYAGSRLSSGDNAGIDLFVSSTGKAGFIIDIGSTLPRIDSTTSVNTGSFFHVIAIRRAGVCEMWVNGVSEGTPSASCTFDMSATTIGNFLLGGTPLNPMDWSGKLDGIMIFNRALTSSEIGYLYNSGSGTQALTGNGYYNKIATAVNAAGSHFSTSNTNKDVYIEGALEVDGTIYGDGGFIGDGSGLTNLPSSSGGWTDGGTNVYVGTTTDNVGIGTALPTGKIDIRGGAAYIWTGSGTNTTATSSGELYVGGDLEVDGTITGDGSGLTNLPSSSGGWTDSGTNVYVSTSTDNVGIGTTQPIGLLTISSTAAQDLFLVEDNGAADASPFVVRSDGNVGIGTTVPGVKLGIGSASQFQVNSSGTIAQLTGVSGTSIAATSASFSNAGTVNISNVNSGGGSAVVIRGGAHAGSFVGLQSTTATGTSDYIKFTVGTNGGTEAMRIITDGNVGIGTTVPIGKLNVVGDEMRVSAVGGGSNTNALGSGELYVQGDLEVDGTIYNSGGTMLSGTYTPSLTNVANLDASTAYAAQYLRVGNTITVSGKIDVDPTLTVTTTQLGISLPIASSFTTEEDCGGTAFAKAIATQGAAIFADATNARAQMEWKSTDTTNQSMYFNFSYQVK